MRILLVLVAAASTLTACDSDPTADSGPRDAGGDAGPVGPCSASSECEDGLFCTEHACRPGAADADPRGCVEIEGPCPGMDCREGERACVAMGCDGDLDADGDGHDRLGCGGDDCDDFDPTAYPALGEVCDAQGHDEDCNPATYGDTDADADGFVSAGCCNGSLCGPDCDDSAADTSPAGRETCNGRDDDCDGSVDEEDDSEPLCPGGTCRGGGCVLGAWDRTYGSTGWDGITAIAMDSRGHVYAAGFLTGSGSIGGEPFGGGVDLSFIVSYAADGTFRWLELLGGSGIEFVDYVVDLDFAAEPDTLYAILSSGSGGELGSGIFATRTGHALVAFDPTGEVRWHRELDYASRTPSQTYVTATRDGVVVAGQFAGAVQLGGVDAVTAVGNHDGFVAWYDHEGTYVRGMSLSAAPGGEVALQAPAGVDDGSTVVAGWVTGGGADLGLGARTITAPAASAMYAVRIDSSGTVVSDYWVPSPGTAYVEGVVVTADGTYLVGEIPEPVDFGGGIEGASGRNGYVLRLADDLGFQDVRTWALGTLGGAASVGATSTGDIAVVGGLQGTVNFGGGARSSVGRFAAFLAVFEPDLRPRYDILLEAGVGGTCPSLPCSSSAVDIAIGPADSTAIAGSFEGAIDLGSGLRSSEGGRDGFVVRLAR